MVTLEKRSKTETNKPSVSAAKKRKVGIGGNVYGDLFNMVEDIFGPDQQRRVKK